MAILKSLYVNGNSRLRGDLTLDTPLSVASGGTGYNNWTDFRNALNIPSITYPISVANGGTGVTSLDALKNALNIPTLPISISNGGTGNTVGYIQTGFSTDVSVNKGAKATSEGDMTVGTGTGSHAEGYGTTALGNYSHAEGEMTNAGVYLSHTEGQETLTKGTYPGAVIEYISPVNNIKGTTSSNATFNWGSHAGGTHSYADGQAAFVHGIASVAKGHGAVAVGVQTTATNTGSHAEGYLNKIISANNTTTLKFIPTGGTSSTSISGLNRGTHVEGCLTCAYGYGAHTEGLGTLATNYASHAEGISTTAGGIGAHAEGFGTTGWSEGSHAEGGDTYAMARHSHAEGLQTSAGSAVSHAGGFQTITSAMGSVAIGANTTAMNPFSVALGINNKKWQNDLVEIGDGFNNVLEVNSNGTTRGMDIYSTNVDQLLVASSYLNGSLEFYRCGNIMQVTWWYTLSQTIDIWAEPVIATVPVGWRPAYRCFLTIRGQDAGLISPLCIYPNGSVIFYAKGQSWASGTWAHIYGTYICNRQEGDLRLPPITFN